MTTTAGRDTLAISRATPSNVMGYTFLTPDMRILSISQSFKSDVIYFPIALPPVFMNTIKRATV